jgi:3,4-dihydroxy 2-butanone 4-phosphate synthase / GTP cyclohydrolase II
MKLLTSSDALFRSVYGDFRLTAFEMAPDRTHIAMRLGDLANEAALLVRVQSACTTGTALGAVICDCRDQVEKALALIAREGRGLFLYLDEEARGHGLREKVNGMAEMNRGASTVTAYTGRGLPADRRTYADVGPILDELKTTRNLRLITNNPAKIAALSSYGYEVKERVPIEVEPTDLTRAYLMTKKHEFGHVLTVVD